MKNQIINNSYIFFFFLFINVIILSISNIQPTDYVIHDPLVRRVFDKDYFSDDWWINMHSAYNTHFFYANLISLHKIFFLSKTFWEIIIYFVLQQIFIFSLFRISRLTKLEFNLIFFLIFIHYIFFTYLAPAFDNFGYGRFIPLDNYLTPRYITNTFAFLSISYLFSKNIYKAIFFLGVSSLFHVQSALLYLIIFCIIFFLQSVKSQKKILCKETIKKLVKYLMVYFFSGGLFLLYVICLSINDINEIPFQKFYWTWIYIRAPYLDVTQNINGFIKGPYSFFTLLIIFLFLFLLNYLYKKKNIRLEYLLISLGFYSLLSFIIFFVSLKIYPNEIIFKLYSFRLINIFFYSVFLLISIYVLQKLNNFKIILSTFLLIFFTFLIFQNKSKVQKNLIYIINLDAKNNSNLVVKKIEQLNETILMHPKIILDPNIYISSFVSFKNFGFTNKSMAEWIRRLNLLCDDQITKEYNRILKNKKMNSTAINWNNCFYSISENQIEQIMKNHNLNYLLTKNKDNRFNNMKVVEYYRDYKLLKFIY